MPIVDLDKFRPKTAQVVVGHLEIQMGVATIYGTEAALEVLASVPWEGAVGPLAGIVRKFLEARAAGDKGAMREVLNLIERDGAALITALRPLLGKDLFPTLRKCAVAFLDTPSVRKMLTSGGDSAPLVVEGDEDVERDEDGVYVGSSAVRCWVKENIAFPQIQTVFTTGIRLNDFAGAMGNLWAGLTAATPTPEAVEPPSKVNGAQKPAKAAKR